MAILPRKALPDMPLPDNSNEWFQLAARFVNQTNRHLFLTGKAGTGKTTFLKYIRENSLKKMAVVAPTGVAAINAGGVTMHSFFQLPLGSFIPVHEGGWNSQSNFNTPVTLFKNLRLSRDKRELMQELDLLVIDEVSMLRADLLDEMDVILRHVRKQPYKPFGGLQMLYIGDLFQLPPVVNHEEWEILKAYYRSPFFFDAQVMQQAPPVYLELKKIYRQHETEFINLLNNIRNNQATPADLERLHRHYRPGYEGNEAENYITLTTHNAKADSINQNKLNTLSAPSYEFHAEVTGDFNEKASPADVVLHLKEGAQVMFIRNDKGESRRYYNGRIATVARIGNDEIFVHFPGEEGELKVEKETWRNIRYRYNREEDHIEEEELGTFKQYPIRLAWAITIHKSQGLTFEKAIIDAGASFAAGQVYVALSRLTTLEGLVLFSRIHAHSIHTDERVLAFTRSEKQVDALQQELEQEQRLFVARSLLQSFDCTNLTERMQEHYEAYESRQIPDKDACINWAFNLLQATMQQKELAVKFVRQLEQLIPQAEEDNYHHLGQRVGAGNDYFAKCLEENIQAIKKHVDEIRVKQKARKYLKDLNELARIYERQKQQLQQAVAITDGLMRGLHVSDLLQEVEDRLKASILPEEALPNNAATDIPKEEKNGTTRPPKGETRRISLQLFKDGHSIAEIAQKREMAVSTIETHLATCILTGDLRITDLVPEERIAPIMKAIEEVNPPTRTAGPVKEKLGNGYTYGEIRAVLFYREWLQQETNVPQ